MPRWTDSSWPKSARNLLGYAASASVLEAKPDVSSPQLKTWIAEWRRRARERRELSELNECDRRDLGISRCDAQTEARKPFWRPVVRRRQHTVAVRPLQGAVQRVPQAPSAPSSARLKLPFTTSSAPISFLGAA